MKFNILELLNIGQSRSKFVKSYNPIVYYPLQELSGTVANDASGNNRHGTYSGAAGLLLANTAGPFGGYVPLFGTSGTVNMNFLTAAGASINPSSGAIVAAVKIPVANYTDTTARLLINLLADAQNFIQISKSATNNRLVWRRTANNSNAIRNKDGVTAEGWLVLGLDWDEATNKVRAYYNGVQEGADLTAPAWTGGALTLAVLGAGDAVGANEWNAWIGETSIFSAPLGAGGHLALAQKFFRG